MKEFLLKVKEDVNKTFPESFIQNLKPENLFYRIINFIFFGWLISMYIYIPFLVYMSNYGFFSYDLFNDGLFAIKIISLNMLVLMIGFSFILTGGFGIALASSNSKYSVMKYNKWLILVNIIILILIIFILIGDNSLFEKRVDKIAWFLFLFSVSLPISIHISLIFLGSIKAQFISTFFSFCIILPALFFSMFMGSASKLTSNIFKSFNLGGDIPVKILNKIDKSEQIGKLIFLSPDNIYLSNSTEEKIILERKDSEIIFFKNN
ncbi:hypothetical protein [Aliarcobacter butzleri]|uniref:hypothetical protein n=1 Tax=Aliarcobacter butzleri TaxID=28197 RepID=UPI002B24D5E7|nr:hypothetical protein [Aliarcobacter butzleri]